MPSYDCRMVHFVERNRGRPLSRAYSKQDWAKPATLASVLNLCEPGTDGREGRMSGQSHGDVKQRVSSQEVKDAWI